MPTEFNHITVPSKDLEKSIDFYTSLGMQLIEHEAGHHAHFENQEHEVIFTAYYNLKNPDYEVKVYFEVDNLDDLEIRSCLLAGQVRENVLKTETANWQGKELHLSDPDGNHVVLYEKLTADVVPPWRKNE